MISTFGSDNHNVPILDKEKDFEQSLVFLHHFISRLIEWRLENTLMLAETFIHYLQKEMRSLGSLQGANQRSFPPTVCMAEPVQRDDLIHLTFILPKFIANKQVSSDFGEDAKKMSLMGLPGLY